MWCHQPALGTRGPGWGLILWGWGQVLGGDGSRSVLAWGCGKTMGVLTLTYP